MYLNNDAVLVHRHVGAHSDGDSVVLFRKADVIATGDISTCGSFPVIDPAKGGSIQGELDALNRLLELTVPAMPLVLKPGRTLLVPGHGRVSDYAELVEYRDMVTTIKDNIEVLIKEGNDAGAGQGGQSDGGLSRALGAGDRGRGRPTVRRGDLQRAHARRGNDERAREMASMSQATEAQSSETHWVGVDHTGRGTRDVRGSVAQRTRRVALLILYARVECRRRPRRAAAAHPRRRPRRARRRRST